MDVSFDRIADRYDSTRGYPEHTMKDILAALEKVLERHLAVLDAGVGTGRFAKPLQDLGFDLVGVDISKRMLDHAKEKGTANLLRANVLNLPFRDAAFGTTLSIHVLHLVSDWRDALKEISRVTTERLVSVAFNKEDSPAEDIRRFYDSTCEELGCIIRHPGMRERELPDLLEPDRDDVIVYHEHPISVADMIRDFETRTYSSQWMVPDEVHEQAIEALREKYEGVEQVIGKERISLLVWRCERLWEFANTTDTSR